MPNHNAIKLQSKVVYVPTLEIVFKSKEYKYTRRILPASGITLTDEISECKHMLRKNTRLRYARSAASQNARMTYLWTARICVTARITRPKN